MAVATGRCAYPSDLTDAQWALIEPWLSDRAWTGRPRTLDLRAVVNAVNRSIALRQSAAEAAALFD